ncbi:hypothetical protein CKQ90_27355, partial [Klebsiella pneumoniae]
ELGLSVPQANILAPGYSKGHVEDCLQERFGSAKTLLQGIFVNSTISLEGVVRWLSQVGLTGSEQPPMGCFDWDPLSICWGHDIDMVSWGLACRRRIFWPPAIRKATLRTACRSGLAAR